jgi:hypothetical protein
MEPSSGGDTVGMGFSSILETKTQELAKLEVAVL